MVEAAPVGSRPFAGITPGAALRAIRRMLEGIGVKDAAAYRCHDLRRGHALDLQLSGRFVLGGVAHAQPIALRLQAHRFGRSWRLASGARLPF